MWAIDSTSGLEHKTTIVYFSSLTQIVSTEQCNTCPTNSALHTQWKDGLSNWEIDIKNISTVQGMLVFQIAGKYTAITSAINNVV
jgi:hypothetical protein